MAEERTQRRLAAVLAADVVGYSRLMEVDEAGTLAALKARRRDVLEPLVAKHEGRVFKVTGDGALIEFVSAVSAVNCAVELQQAMATANLDQPEDRHIVLRIGINLGDIMVDRGDLYGDGVNIAARLETIAGPGDILISGTAHDYVRNKLKVGLDDLGAQNLKNIAEPVRAYRVTGMPAAAVTLSKPPADKPSIAVLPFTNLSGDSEQQYFSDGITDDIITELSRWHQLSVQSRNSSFQYRDKSTDVKRIGRELGVRYIVEGSVRRVGERTRVSAQLIDADSNKHVWAERYDRAANEIFAVQDEVVRTIVATLVGRVHAAGAELASRKSPAVLAAYEYVLRGRAQPWGNPQADAEACKFYEKAIELDPGYGLAYALLALMKYSEWSLDTSGSNAALDKAFELAMKAVQLDENESFCHFMLGQAHLCRRSFQLAEQYHRRAVEMNPNNPEHIADMGALIMYLGRPDEGLEWLAQARRVDPYYGPAWYWHQVGLAHYTARRYEDAISALERSQTMPAWVVAYIGACHAQAGRIAQGRECTSKALSRNPALSVKHFASKEPFKDPADLDHLLEGLRKAGLPE